MTTDFPASGQLGPEAGSLARRAGVRRMKTIATAALVAAALVYVATLGSTGVWGFVNAGAEAAMVGALADWFAVTALFRRPLGLPIPHTAIIPERKDQLGESLQQFVAGNFLTESVVRDQLSKAHIAARIGEWLAEPVNATRVVDEASAAARGALRVMKDDDVAPILQSLLTKHVAGRSWSPMVGSLVERVVNEGGHHRLVDLGVRHLQEWLKANPDRVRRVVAAQAPLWSPTWVDEMVANRVYETAVKFVDEISAQPRHAVRVALDDVLTGLGRQLLEDPQAAAQFDGFVLGVAERSDLRAAMVQLWAGIREGLEVAVTDPDSDVRRRVREGLMDLGTRMSQDQEFAARIDAYLQEAILHVVTTYKDDLVTVISETVKRWDGQQTARLIEEHVGRDLQFIRLNGTLVGGLAGVAIHAVSLAVN